MIIVFFFKKNNIIMILISPWNPIRNILKAYKNPLMTVWEIVPWGRGILIYAWNPVRNPHDCMVSSIWYLEATCSGYMIRRSTMFWLTP